MIEVSDIFDDAVRILGTCDETFVFRRITQAVEALANSGQWDPLTGYADLCVSDCYVTLPGEIETPLAINIGGHPSVGRDTLFSFHLNGPGDGWGQSCRWEWIDRGDVCTYRELIAPSKLVAFVQRPEDANSELWVYGRNDQNQILRSTDATGALVDGYQVPTIYGYAVPDSGAPTVTRITRVRKANTAGQIRLSSYDNATNTGTLLGIYEHYETEPIYRRIKLSTNCAWIRMAYRKRTTKITRRTDHIPLHSSYAVLLMLRALKHYDEGALANAVGFEANAVRFLNNEEVTRNPPGVESPLQVDNRSWAAWDEGLE